MLNLAEPVIVRVVVKVERPVYTALIAEVAVPFAATGVAALSVKLLQPAHTGPAATASSNSVAWSRCSSRRCARFTGVIAAMGSP